MLVRGEARDLGRDVHGELSAVHKAHPAGDQLESDRKPPSHDGLANDKELSQEINRAIVIHAPALGGERAGCRVRVPESGLGLFLGFVEPLFGHSQPLVEAGSPLDPIGGGVLAAPLIRADDPNFDVLEIVFSERIDQDVDLDQLVLGLGALRVDGKIRTEALAPVQDLILEIVIVDLEDFHGRGKDRSISDALDELRGRRLLDPIVIANVLRVEDDLDA